MSRSLHSNNSLLSHCPYNAYRHFFIFQYSSRSELPLSPFSAILSSTQQPSPRRTVLRTTAVLGAMLLTSAAALHPCQVSTLCSALWHTETAQSISSAYSGISNNQEICSLLIHSRTAQPSTAPRQNYLYTSWVRNSSSSPKRCRKPR